MRIVGAIREWWHETLHGVHHRIVARLFECPCMEGYVTPSECRRRRYTPVEAETIRLVATDLETGAIGSVPPWCSACQEKHPPGWHRPRTSVAR